MRWKFPYLTEISPKADRDLGQAGKYFSYQCIFPAEWDIFFYEAGAKKCYVIILYIVVIIL